MKKHNPGAPCANGARHSIPVLLLLGFLSVAILTGVGLAAQGGGRDGAPFMHTEITVLQSGWTDGAGNSVALPVTLPYQESGYQLETVLQPEDGDFQCLLFSAKYMNVRLFLDGQELGSCLCRPEGQEGVIGKTYTLFRLPEDFSGSTLRLEAEPLLGSDCQYEIVAPRMGQGGALVYETIVGELLLLGISIVIFCFGLFLLVCGGLSLRMLSAPDGMQAFQTNYLHIGMFAMLFALYSTAITDTVHLFVANAYFIYLMEFFLLALVPLPLLALVADACTPRFRGLLLAAGGAVFLNFIVQMVLHFAWGMELRNAVPATHLLMVASALLLVPALVSVGRQKDGRWWLPLSFLPILVGALLDIFRFYLPQPYQKAAGFQLGVLLFLLLQTTNLIRKSFLYYKNSLKANTYQQMAYTDALTGLANRTAFELKITEMQERLDQYSVIWCISADINNLKQTNDAFGHSAGDVLIQDAARLLEEAVENRACVYRTGGDEFELFLFDLPESDVCAIRARFADSLAAYNASHEHGLSVAMGCDRFHFSHDDSIAKLLSRADALMYQDKRNWKEARGGSGL